MLTQLIPLTIELIVLAGTGHLICWFYEKYEDEILKRI